MHVGESGESRAVRQLPADDCCWTNVVVQYSWEVLRSKLRDSVASPEFLHMPLLQFSEIPSDGRVWLFGAAAPIDDVDERRLLTTVDRFLASWKAHGHPLFAARDWRDGRFLAIAVDRSREGASGCSIDGLFQALKRLEEGIGTTLLNGSLVYYRDAEDFVHGVSRDDFSRLSREGHVGPDTRVMDLSITDAATYRAQFERRASESWHAGLLAKA